MRVHCACVLPMQVYNTSEVGGALVMQYHLEELPATYIVDPITGAKLWQKCGFISPDSLIEELVPFLDVGACYFLCFLGCMIEDCRPLGATSCWPVPVCT